MNAITLPPPAPLPSLAARIFWAFSEDTDPFSQAEMLRAIRFHVAERRMAARRKVAEAQEITDGDPERELMLLDAEILRLRANAWEALVAQGGDLAQFRAEMADARSVDRQRAEVCKVAGPLILAREMSAYCLRETLAALAQSAGRLMAMHGAAA